MTVEAAELKNHLSEYLQQIRATGETITICHGAEPLATLAPLAASPKSANGNLIDRLLASPAMVQDFQPLTRDEIYERK